MFKKSTASVLLGSMMAIVACGSATAQPVVVDQPLARRGADDRGYDDRGGRRFTEEVVDVVAKRGRAGDDNPKPEGEEDGFDDHGAA
ncbi:hypothetical protein [Noviherbaspirillum denitrificans]|uniref:Secreted protein n=1 Tax=Noviherbaspirillum denitrificans TaxID=1968433 RepID=A0A254TMT9_9BURK|nr:hypothetical protein [Noviherbaspirillum denitrificans]OWW22662.1 hypothetical protein AYR66_27335 [Noviherbaspirillum denitrificans]